LETNKALIEFEARARKLNLPDVYAGFSDLSGLAQIQTGISNLMLGQAMQNQYQSPYLMGQNQLGNIFSNVRAYS